MGRKHSASMRYRAAGAIAWLTLICLFGLTGFGLTGFAWAQSSAAPSAATKSGAKVTPVKESALPPGDEPPPTPFSRLAAAGTAADHEGTDYLIAYQSTVNRVKPSGVALSDEYVLYKVLTPAGARQLSVQDWHYEPWSSHLEVRSAAIIRGDSIIPVEVSAVSDLPAPQYGIYWNAREQVLQLPRLQVNDGIEIRTFRKGYSYALLGEDDAGGARASSAQVQASEPDDAKYIPPMPGEYFDIVIFEASVPIVEKRYELCLPASKRLHSRVYNGPLFASTSYDADTTRYSWWALDIKARPGEPRQASLSDYAAKVVMATVESWEAKSRWFFDVNAGQFDVTPEIQAKADEILTAAGVSRGTESQKAEVLVHWVAQNIRYSGQTMGEGEGFTLHPGAMIFAQRSGVCKDIAGMLVTMMRAAGLDSYAAMTMAGSRIEEVPADQFNHCVVALRRTDGEYEMYDPTWVPYMNDIWSKYETEQQYLVGSTAGEGLSEIPYSPPAGSPLHITHNAELLPDGTLIGTFRLSGAGALDGRLRGIVGYNRILDIADDIATMLSHISPAIEDVRFRHLDRDDFSQNMWIEMSYRAPGFALPVAGGLEFKSPMMAMTMNDAWLFRAGITDWPEERDSDIFLYFTQLIDGTERIRLPRGFAAAETPASDSVDVTYAFFQGKSEMKGRDLVITQRAEVRRRQIPPDGYADFRRAISEAGNWEDVRYRVEPKKEAK